MSSTTNKLHHADVLLRCSKEEHENCVVLRDALMKKFPNVTTAYVTRTKLDTDYCVSASAIVRDNEIDDFENQLKKLHQSGKNKFNVKNIKLFVSNE